MRIKISIIQKGVGEMLSESQVKEFNTLFAVELAMGYASNTSPGKWGCSLSEMVIGDYVVIPLTSAKMLKSESYWMQNCCSDFTSRCAELEYCVFSIRTRPGKRLATLGVRMAGGYWRFDQCFGPRNEEVLEFVQEYTDDKGYIQGEWATTEIYSVAHEVVRLMNSQK